MLPGWDHKGISIDHQNAKWLMVLPWHLSIVERTWLYSGGSSSGWERRQWSHVVVHAWITFGVERWQRRGSITGCSIRYNRPQKFSLDTRKVTKTASCRLRYVFATIVFVFNCVIVRWWHNLFICFVCQVDQVYDLSGRDCHLGRKRKARWKQFLFPAFIPILCGRFMLLGLMLMFSSLAQNVITIALECAQVSDWESASPSKRKGWSCAFGC